MTDTSPRPLAAGIDPRGVAIGPIVDTPHPYTTAYTDGSSTGKVGPGGWAWAVDGGPEASGGALDTTNQRMELQAAHEAVKALPGLLLVVSDSAYVVNCFAQQWYLKWHRTGWRKVKNRDLWEPFVADVLARHGQVRFAWVKGHSGNPMNDHVDALAKAARMAVGVAPVRDDVCPWHSQSPEAVTRRQA